MRFRRIRVEYEMAGDWAEGKLGDRYTEWIVDTRLDNRSSELESELST
jgi:hypothetical protein